MSNDLSAPSQPALNAEGGEQKAMSTPLGTGEFIGDVSLDPLGGGESSKRINSSALLIAAVVLISVAGLFSMRKLAQVTAAAAIDGEIEQTIIAFIDSVKGQENDPDGNPDAEEGNGTILAVLGAAYSERQVPLSDVKRNPFIIETPATVVDPVVVEDPAELDRRQKIEYERRLVKRRAELERCKHQMRLKSIMGGSSPLAIVNDEIVRIGDVVKIANERADFRVTSISRTSVDLVAKAAEFNIQVAITLDLNVDD